MTDINQTIDMYQDSIYRLSKKITELTGIEFGEKDNFEFSFQLFHEKRKNKMIESDKLMIAYSLLSITMALIDQIELLENNHS